jgi:hypothetical protein
MTRESSRNRSDPAEVAFAQPTLYPRNSGSEPSTHRVGNIGFRSDRQPKAMVSFPTENECDQVAEHYGQLGSNNTGRGETARRGGISSHSAAKRRKMNCGSKAHPWQDKANKYRLRYRYCGEEMLSFPSSAWERLPCEALLCARLTLAGDRREAELRKTPFPSRAWERE